SFAAFWRPCSSTSSTTWTAGCTSTASPTRGCSHSTRNSNVISRRGAPHDEGAAEARPVRRCEQAEMMHESLNVFGEPLETCSEDPMTGFFRDGCCNTGDEDAGSHTVCVAITQEFLEFSRFRGNDLSTPRPGFGFSGLKPGDRW